MRSGTLFPTFVYTVNERRSTKRRLYRNENSFERSSAMSDILKGVLIPFLGTILGAACVFLMKKNFDQIKNRSQAVLFLLSRLIMGF